jgi:predicted dehydrogenase
MTEYPPDGDPVRTGVIGVGNMGRHHARVYNELTGAELVGVADADEERAASVAAEYGTTAHSQDELLARVDAVSVAVPTRFHAEVAHSAIDANVSLLLEKPFVRDPAVGERLCDRAEAAGVVLQVGHIERFNPVVPTLQRVLDDEGLISLDARRLGPPVDRDTTDGVVFDLMIHDIDIVTTLVGSPVADVSAVGAADGQRVSAQIEFESGVVATLSASRVTEKKVRDLAITTDDCHVEVDYADQQVEIHRHSLPEYVDDDGDLRYRHESVIERPMVENGEPLKAELSSFLTSHRENEPPKISGRDALLALRLARRIDGAATRQPRPAKH